jgi:hypothetical protein
MASIFNLPVAVNLFGDEDRAKEIMAALAKVREVRDAEGGWWRVAYIDFDSEAEALTQLEADLAKIDDEWSLFLQVRS